MYGISLLDYNNMLKEQDNKCKICELDQAGFHFSLSVDHCHETGRVRGLLCSNCNQALGCLKDSTELFQKSIKYLESN